MKKALAILVVSVPAAYAEVPHTFFAGERAKASEVNENFRSLDQRLGALEQDSGSVDLRLGTLEQSGNSTNQRLGTLEQSGNSTNQRLGALEQSSSSIDQRLSTLEQGSGSVDQSGDGWQDVQVNGVAMQLRIADDERYNPFPAYLIRTPTGLVFVFSQSGYPVSRTPFYASADCSGTPHIGEQNSTQPSQSNVLPQRRLVYANKTLYMTDTSQVVSLHSKSWRYSSGYCYNSTQQSFPLALALVANDPAITGINSVPLTIRGIGAPYSPQVVGSPATYEVHDANGLIGYTGYHYASGSGSSTIRVELVHADWQGKTISLQPDGSYSYYSANFFGFALPTETLYYMQEDCQGNAYVEIGSIDSDGEWYDTSEVQSGYVRNGNQYYQLGDTLYQSSQRSSYKQSGSSCTNSSRSNNFAYKRATAMPSPIASFPALPQFTPPIRVDYAGAVSSINLPEAQ